MNLPDAILQPNEKSMKKSYITGRGIRGKRSIDVLWLREINL